MRPPSGAPHASYGHPMPPPHPSAHAASFSGGHGHPPAGLSGEDLEREVRNMRRQVAFAMLGDIPEGEVFASLRSSRHHSMEFTRQYRRSGTEDGSMVCGTTEGGTASESAWGSSRLQGDSNGGSSSGSSPNLAAVAAERERERAWEWERERARESVAAAATGRFAGAAGAAGATGTARAGASPSASSSSAASPSTPASIPSSAAALWRSRLGGGGSPSPLSKPPAPGSHLPPLPFPTERGPLFAAAGDTGPSAPPTAGLSSSHAASPLGPAPSISPSPPKHRRFPSQPNALPPGLPLHPLRPAGLGLPVQLPGDLTAPTATPIPGPSSRPGHRKCASQDSRSPFQTMPAGVSLADFPRQLPFGDADIDSREGSRVVTVHSAPFLPPASGSGPSDASTPLADEFDPTRIPLEQTASDIIHEKPGRNARHPGRSYDPRRSIRLTFTVDGAVSLGVSKDQIEHLSRDGNFALDENDLALGMENGHMMPVGEEEDGPFFLGDGDEDRGDSEGAAAEEAEEEEAEAKSVDASVQESRTRLGGVNEMLGSLKLDEQEEVAPSISAAPPCTPVDLHDIGAALLEKRVKPVNIVMLVVGTRGDVQPFVGIGLRLKEYGHRVRIATHKVFREFVTEFGLEFFPIGGDPKVLSEFVVKHRGLNPGLNINDARRQIAELKSILYSSYAACTEPDPDHPELPFTADAIVANPPAYGHTHVAERLNVPLHLVFTMPWTPTKHFPCPFARIHTEIGTHLTGTLRDKLNYLSYLAIDRVAWIGLGGMMRKFRSKVLGLTSWDEKVNGSHAIHEAEVPMTYIWSPSLVERPSDWPERCQVVGFVNVELNKLISFEPPREWQDFLDAGPPPVYIGFGSLVVQKPHKLTERFLKAIKATGVRAIIQKGWGGLGAGVDGPVDNVLFIGPAPHDWLFPRCCAVVHHGGAGTTACGLYCGKPTFIVPFFGDQPFWGAACHKAGVGPAPVDIDFLKTKKIIAALNTLVTKECQEAARRLQEQMMQENGTEACVDRIHQSIYGVLLNGEVHKWMKRGPSLGAASWTEGPPQTDASSTASAGASVGINQTQGNGSNGDAFADFWAKDSDSGTEAVEEELFENERWGWGWGHYFLPSDTFNQWSVKKARHGVQHQPPPQRRGVLGRISGALTDGANFARRSSQPHHRRGSSWGSRGEAPSPLQPAPAGAGAGAAAAAAAAASPAKPQRPRSSSASGNGPTAEAASPAMTAAAPVAAVTASPLQPPAAVPSSSARSYSLRSVSHATSSLRDEVAPSLPGERWRWSGDWAVDMQGVGDGCVDSDGWFYALDFRYLKRHPGAGKRSAYHFVRRRRWTRTRVMVTVPQQQQQQDGSTAVAGGGGTGGAPHDVPPQQRRAGSGDAVQREGSTPGGGGGGGGGAEAVANGGDGTAAVTEGRGTAVVTEGCGTAG